MSKVACEREDKLLNIHEESETCEVCASLPEANPAPADEGRWLIERAARDIARHYKRAVTPAEIALLAAEFYEATERLFVSLEEE